MPGWFLITILCIVLGSACFYFAVAFLAMGWKPEEEIDHRRLAAGFRLLLASGVFGVVFLIYAFEGVGCDGCF